MIKRMQTDPASDKKNGFDLADVVEANNRFAINLYQKLAQKGATNLFFSPASLHTALGMSLVGARETTYRETADALHIAGPPEKISDSFGEFLRELTSTPDDEPPMYDLHLANALWISRKLELRPDYVREVSDRFHAHLAQLDFLNRPEPSRIEINEWIERKTNDQIRDLLPPDSIQSITQLVLTNAVYFKSKWKHPFLEDSTKILPFQPGWFRRVKWPHMFQQENFRYMENDLCQSVALPYQGGASEMNVFLPKKTEKLSRLENDLTFENLTAWMGRYREEEVAVTLPRFKTSWNTELKDVLAETGIKTAFSDDADFSGISDTPLKLDRVFHQAFVDVTEKGTEAAAATAMTMLLGCSTPPKPKIFKANRPFLFLIRHLGTGAILFMGKLADPKE